ncbi:hypothetical protein HOF92_05595 [bacterium]|jgi:hypothetical protein|nr:hypothetical protein [bacterium]
MPKNLLSLIVFFTLTLMSSAVEILPGHKAQLILRVLENTNLSSQTIRIAVCPSPDGSTNKLIKHLRKEPKLQINGQTVSILVGIYDKESKAGVDVVILADSSQPVVPGVLCIAFDERQVEQGATVGIAAIKDHVSLFLNPSSAKKLGIRFDVGMVRVARLKGGNGS